MNAKPKIVAGIPAFNEENTIAKVVVHAGGHVDRILVVDDGNSDDTGLIAEKLGATVIEHARNWVEGQRCVIALIGQRMWKLMFSSLWMLARPCPGIRSMDDQRC